MHYIEKSLPLRRLDFFDRRHVCHLSRSGLLIYNDGSQPVLSHLSLTTSKKVVLIITQTMSQAEF